VKRQTLYWRTRKSFIGPGHPLSIYRIVIRGFDLRGSICLPGEPWRNCWLVVGRYAGFCSEGFEWMTRIGRREAERLRRRRAR